MSGNFGREERGAIIGRSGENLSEMRGIVQNEISRFWGAFEGTIASYASPTPNVSSEHAPGHVRSQVKLGLGRVGYVISIASP